MADIADKAQELEDWHRDLALNAARRNAQIAATTRCRDEIACEDCGEDIAPARLKALPFAVRCTECQGRYEKERRA